VIFGGHKGPRRLPGLGAGLTPELCEPSLIDECIYVSDVDCITGCRWLIGREAILAGASSGAVVYAMSQLKPRVAAGANCVLILPDRGERYLDTVYSDDWVSQQFGDIAARWAARATAREQEDAKAWTGNTIS
jgi:cysteine synthase